MKNGIYFLLVGAMATAIHVAVFWILSQHLLPGLWPEASNTLAFGVAFLVSFLGHRHLSFPGATISVWVSLLRFGGSALAGFVTQQLVFIALVRVLGWPHMVSLVVALAAAAGQTYALGRYWAFRRT